MKKTGQSSERRMFDFDGNFYTYTGKIFDVMLVSIYWLIGCIPIITIGASFSALYAAVTKSVRCDRDSVTRQFWHAYKQNLVSSIPLTLIYVGVIFLMFLNIGILDARLRNLFGIFFMVLYALVIVLFIIAACYAFPALSRFDMPSGWFVKLSFYMTVKHLPVSLVLFGLFAVSYLTLLARPALFMVIPGAVSCVASYMIEPLLDRHMPKEENASGENCE